MLTGLEGQVEPQVRTEKDVHIVDVTGRLTHGAPETEALGDVLRDLLHTGKKKIVLNIDKVVYIDSASLGVLVAHYKRAIERGGMIKVLKPNDKTLSVLVATRLNLVFDIFSNEEEAVASF